MRARWWSVLASLALVGCPAAAGEDITVATDTRVQLVPESERRQAPALDGEVLAGEPFRSQDLEGDVVLVNFWGSWCGPCRLEQPLLEAGWKRYRDRGVRFIGVNTRRDQRAAALAFLEEFSVTYPSLYDPSSAIAFEFGVRAMPATFVIDRRGMIAAEIVGGLRSRAELDELIEGVLGS